MATSNEASICIYDTSTSSLSVHMSAPPSIVSCRRRFPVITLPFHLPKPAAETLFCPPPCYNHLLKPCRHHGRRRRTDESSLNESGPSRAESGCVHSPHIGDAVPARQRSTMPAKLGFSSAAATRSLSFSCLLTAASLAWPPGLTAMSTCMESNRSFDREDGDSKRRLRWVAC